MSTSGGACADASLPLSAKCWRTPPISTKRPDGGWARSINQLPMSVMTAPMTRTTATSASTALLLQRRRTQPEDFARALRRIEPEKVLVGIITFDNGTTTPDLAEEPAVFVQMRAGFGENAPHDIHAVGAAGERQTRL